LYGIIVGGHDLPFDREKRVWPTSSGSAPVEIGQTIYPDGSKLAHPQGA
jgi:hypothetical protein